MPNIPLRLKDFPRVKTEGIPEGEGMYLTVYPESSPNTDSISFYPKDPQIVPYPLATLKCSHALTSWTCADVKKN